MVFKFKACIPIAVLLEPVVFWFNAPRPSPELLEPVVNANAPAPIAVL